MPHKPDSLWTLLNKTIRERGQISYGEFVQICLEEGYKVSNGERRLRKSESPNVEAIMGRSKRNTPYIAGYKWVGEREKIDFDKLKELASEIKEYTKQEQVGMFTYRVDPKHAKTVFNDPN